MKQILNWIKSEYPHKLGVFLSVAIILVSLLFPSPIDNLLALFFGTFLFFLFIGFWFAAPTHTFTKNFKEGSVVKIIKEETTMARGTLPISSKISFILCMIFFIIFLVKLAVIIFR